MDGTGQSDPRPSGEPLAPVAAPSGQVLVAGSAEEAGRVARLYRAHGLSAHAVAVEALADELGRGVFDAVVLCRPDARGVHALSRATRNLRTPVVVLADDLLEERASAAASYRQASPTAALSGALARDRAAFRQLALDPRVTWIFRSAWQRDRARAEAPVPDERAHVIAAHVASAQAAVDPARRTSVFFSRPFDDARGHCVDLFVLTVLALSKLEGFERLRFVVHGDGPLHDELLRPVARLPNVRVVRSGDAAALRRECGIALLPVRAGAQDLALCEAAGEGLVVVSTARPGVAEWLPHLGTLAPGEDPAALARIVHRVAGDAGRFAETSARLVEHVAQRFAASDTIEREVALVRGLSPAATEAVAPGGGPPRLTVAVPAYNTADLLARCVTSLVRCAEPGTLEVLVIDDGSTDETPAVAAELAQTWPAFVRVLRQENRGHGGAINTGLREAQGRYFRVVDSDDWVDSAALRALLDALASESVDVALTDYAEVWPTEPLPRPVTLFDRLAPGATVTWEALVDPLYGLSSWGPILATSTLRTEVLRASGLRLSERSAYVDIEYCTIGLARVQTLKYLGLDVYRYSLGRDGQTASAESHRRRYREHERVIERVSDWVSSAGLPDALRTYVVERVLWPIVAAHLEILREVVKTRGAEAAFRRGLARYPFLADAPALRRKSLSTLAKQALRRALPAGVVARLRDLRRAEGRARPLRRLVGVLRGGSGEE